jgi:hypothetical protein
MKISALSWFPIKMLGGLPLYGPPSFPHMAVKVAIRSATDMDGKPYWPIPKGGCGEGACGVEASNILACSIVTFIFGRLTMMSLSGGLI